MKDETRRTKEARNPNDERKTISSFELRHSFVISNFVLRHSAPRLRVQPRQIVGAAGQNRHGQYLRDFIRVEPANRLLDLVVEARRLLAQHCHSWAVSIFPCQRYVLAIGPVTCTQAASRSSTSDRAIRSASSRCSVVVTTWM